MFFFFQAEDGIRDLVRSRGLGDVYKRQFQSPSANLRVISDNDRNGLIIRLMPRLNTRPVAVNVPKTRIMVKGARLAIWP